MTTPQFSFQEIWGVGGRELGMIGLFRACDSSIISGTRLFVTISPSCKYFFPSWETSFQHSSARTVNLELLLTRFQFQCYSSKKSGGGSSRKRKLDPKPLMKDDKEAFFVVRKGDLVGVYKSLSDCQAQVGTSVTTSSLNFDVNFLYIPFLFDRTSGGDS